MAIRNNREFNLFNFPVHVIFFSQTTFNMVDAGRSNLMLVKIQETNYLGRKKQANEHNDQKHLDLCVFSIITSKAECYIIIIFCYDSVTVWIKTSKYLHYFVEWMLLLIKSLWKSFWLELTWTRWPFTVAITDILFMYSYM